MPRKRATRKLARTEGPKAPSSFATVIVTRFFHSIAGLGSFSVWPWVRDYSVRTNPTKARRLHQVVIQPLRNSVRPLRDDLAPGRAVYRAAWNDMAGHPFGHGSLGNLYASVQMPKSTYFSLCESLNSKLRDERLNGEIFTTLREAQVLIENWRRHCNASGHTHPSAIARRRQKRGSPAQPQPATGDTDFSCPQMPWIKASRLAKTARGDG